MIQIIINQLHIFTEKKTMESLPVSGTSAATKARRFIFPSCTEPNALAHPILSEAMSSGVPARMCKSRQIRSRTHISGIAKERIFQQTSHADRERARMSGGRCLPRTVRPFVPDDGSASPRGRAGPFSPPLHELARAGRLLCPEDAPVPSCSAPDTLRHELLHPEVVPP
jgi:hypothetical protein